MLTGDAQAYPVPSNVIYLGYLFSYIEGQETIESIVQEKVLYE